MLHSEILGVIHTTIRWRGLFRRRLFFLLHLIDVLLVLLVGITDFRVAPQRIDIVAGFDSKHPIIEISVNTRALL